MERKLVLDVRAPESRTIRSVPVPEHRESKIKKKPIRKKGNRRIGVWVVALVCLVLLIFSITLLFSSAQVVITAKSQSVPIDGNFTAQKDAVPPALKFDVMTVTEDQTETIAAETTKEVDAKAQGQIIVYNDWGTASQILAKNTRFENPQGQIYRIAAQITVPGKTLVNGKDVPGSITTTVYADQSGSGYDMKISDLAGDFKIPGFKGGPKYDGFFARLKTDIIGGESGMKAVADPQAFAAAKMRVDAALKDMAYKQALAQKPDSFILFDNASTIQYSSVADTDAPAGKVNVHERATFRGIIFDKKLLAEAVAPALADSIARGDISAEGLENMQFSIQNGDTFVLGQSTTLNFTLKGTLMAISQFSESKLKQALAGKSAQYIPTLLRDFPAIKSADVTIKPFWKRSFPSDTSKITLHTLTQ